MLTRVLGAEFERVIELSNDPRFLTGLIPSANVFTTAEDITSYVFCWADPERQLVVALLTTGKPILSLHVLRLDCAPGCHHHSGSSA